MLIVVRFRPKADYLASKRLDNRRFVQCESATSSPPALIAIPCIAGESWSIGIQMAAEMTTSPGNRNWKAFGTRCFR